MLTISVEPGDKISQDIEKIKERIMKINENLYKELESYSMNRIEGLSRIMLSTCKSDYETANRQTETALKNQNKFVVSTLKHEDYIEKIEDGI